MLFSHIDDLEIPKLANAENDLNGNLQDNGTTPPDGTQPSSPHSPLEDTVVTPSDPLQCPYIESGGAAIQARSGELSDVRLGSDGMLFGVYRYWVHQHPGQHLDGGIVEGGNLWVEL